MIARAEFREEEKRIRQYRKEGKTEAWIKGWLRGWRVAGEIIKAKNQKRKP